MSFSALAVAMGSSQWAVRDTFRSCMVGTIDYFVYELIYFFSAADNKSLRLVMCKV